MLIFESLINFSSLATWLLLPLNAIFLFLDSIVYSLVSYAFELFLRMAQMNFNNIIIWAKPLIDRVEALIMVMILFKLGMTLVQYMLDPDKAEAGGADLVKRLAVVGIFLVSYKLIFGILNEFSMLIIGYNSDYFSTESAETISTDTENSAAIEETFPILTSFGIDLSASDSGLLARLIFGNENNSEDLKSFGSALAAQTLNMFIYDRRKTDENGNVERNDDGTIAVEGNDATHALGKAQENNNFFEIYGVLTKIDITVEYRWPILSAIMGLYLIYTIVKIAIEIGVRTFKLLILQMMAPIAIIAYLDPKTESKVTTPFLSTYYKTYLDAFIRIAAMYIVVALISMFWKNQDTIFNTGDAGLITATLLLILIMVAGFRFVKELPNFISQFLGVDISGSANNGFGKFLSNAAGMGISAIGGYALGRRAGMGGRAALGNAIVSGWNNRGQGIANSIRNLPNSANRATRRQREIDNGIGFTQNLRNRINDTTGRTAVEHARQDNQIRHYSEQNDLINDRMNEADQAILGTTQNGFTFSENESADIAANLAADNQYQTWSQEYDDVSSRLNSGYSADYSSLLAGDNSYQTMLSDLNNVNDRLSNGNYQDISTTTYYSPDGRQIDESTFNSMGGASNGYTTKTTTYTSDQQRQQDEALRNKLRNDLNVKENAARQKAQQDADNARKADEAKRAQLKADMEAKQKQAKADYKTAKEQARDNAIASSGGVTVKNEDGSTTRITSYSGLKNQKKANEATLKDLNREKQGRREVIPFQVGGRK